MNSRFLDISLYNRNVPIVIKMRGQSVSDDVAFRRYAIFLLVAILATFLQKMTDFEAILKLRVFNISICDRKLPILVKMRSQSASDDDDAF